MTVENLIKLLEKANQEADIFTSGLLKDHRSRSLHLVGTIEIFDNYVVIVGDK